MTDKTRNFLKGFVNSPSYKGKFSVLEKYKAGEIVEIFDGLWILDTNNQFHRLIRKPTKKK